MRRMPVLSDGKKQYSFYLSERSMETFDARWIGLQVIGSRSEMIQHLIDLFNGELTHDELNMIMSMRRRNGDTT